MAHAPGDHILRLHLPRHQSGLLLPAVLLKLTGEACWSPSVHIFWPAAQSTQVAAQAYHFLDLSCRSSMTTGMACMRPLLAMAWVAPPLPSSGVWAAASTPRLLTWVLTWWARWRRTSLRTTPATLPPLQVGSQSRLWAPQAKPSCTKTPQRQIPGPSCWHPCALDASGHCNCIQAASTAGSGPTCQCHLCIWTPQWQVDSRRDGAAAGASQLQLCM